MRLRFAKKIFLIAQKMSSACQTWQTLSVSISLIPKKKLEHGNKISCIWTAFSLSLWGFISRWLSFKKKNSNTDLSTNHTICSLLFAMRNFFTANNLFFFFFPDEKKIDFWKLCAFTRHVWTFDTSVKKIISCRKKYIPTWYMYLWY